MCSFDACVLLHIMITRNCDTLRLLQPEPVPCQRSFRFIRTSGRYSTSASAVAHHCANNLRMARRS